MLNLKQAKFNQLSDQLQAIKSNINTAMNDNVFKDYEHFQVSISAIHDHISELKDLVLMKTNSDEAQRFIEALNLERYLDIVRNGANKYVKKFRKLDWHEHDEKDLHLEEFSFEGERRFISFTSLLVILVVVFRIL